MATYRRTKSGGSQSEGASNSASPASSVALSNLSSSQGINNNAPKYGTLVPNRIFVGGISGQTTELELTQLFSKYGNVKATKIIADRAGVSKGYGFITFESEEEVKFLIKDTNEIQLRDRKLNIAPAIKKQVVTPFSRAYEGSSPPPTTPSVYFHNGMPYTYHNGMAFFTQTPHQPTIAAMPPSADIYQSFGPTQNTAPAPYGTPLLLPAHPPVFMPQNFSYQPMPMANGTPQFIYTGSGSPNNNPGSPMSGNQENPQIPTPLPPPHFYPQQYATPEAYYPQQHYYVSYTYGGDYDSQEQQNANDDCSSTTSTPHTDISDRSSNRSPANSPFLMIKNNPEQSMIRTESSSNTRSTPTPVHSNTSDSQVPVVSWQNLKNNAEERELHVRDGRRSFYPSIPPPAPPRGDIMIYQQPSFPSGFPSPGGIYQQQPVQVVMGARGQRPTLRGRLRNRDPITNMPIIPKFPASFNNNNPSAINKNFQEKKPSQMDTNGQQRSPRYARSRPTTRYSQYEPNPNPNPTISYVSNSSPSPQMIQGPERQYTAVDRPIMMTNAAPRWSTTPIAAIPLPKRMVPCKRQNGCPPNLGATNNTNSNRSARKAQAGQESDGDVGGGGDAQAIMQLPLPGQATSSSSEVTSKMQALSLSS